MISDEKPVLNLPEFIVTVRVEKISHGLYLPFDIWPTERLDYTAGHSSTC